MKWFSLEDFWKRHQFCSYWRQVLRCKVWYPSIFSIWNSAATVQHVFLTHQPLLIFWPKVPAKPLSTQSAKDGRPRACYLRAGPWQSTPCSPNPLQGFCGPEQTLDCGCILWASVKIFSLKGLTSRYWETELARNFWRLSGWNSSKLVSPATRLLPVNGQE